MNIFIKLFDLSSSIERNSIIWKLFRQLVLIIANVYGRLIYAIPCRLTKPKESEAQIIVSLTSFPARIRNIWMIIECMKRQTVRPSKILLWLSKKQFPNKGDIPNSILKRQDDIFEVRLVDEDIRSHKKYYYALQENPDSFIVTIDDDIFYPTYLIERLYNAYKINGGIVCTWASKYYLSNGVIAPYNDWPKIVNSTSDNVFFGSGGGTIFPPHTLYKDVCNLNISLKCCPLADDIWLNAMARLQDSKITYIPIFKNLLNIMYFKGIYPGMTDCCVITSADNKFFCTM